jgi:hypothetical protein
VLAVVALAVGAGGAAASSADVWKRLHRPLHIAPIAPGARCPTSRPDNGVDFKRYGVGQGIGRGPAYPTLGRATLAVEFPADAAGFGDSRWSGQKTFWFVSPAYRGSVLIRGRRLDGSDPVRFEHAKTPAIELRIPAGGGGPSPVRSVKDEGQRYLPSYTRVRAPGCYTFQIDGTTFSRVIVFSVPADAWTSIRRPLKLRKVAPGAPCPVSALNESFDFDKHGVGKGIGPGPAWPIGLAQPGSVLRFEYPPPATSVLYGSEWGGNKVLWFVSPDAVGPVLVRGARLDAPDEVRFGLEQRPPAELHLVGAEGHPSATRVRSPGCYAYQVDATGFSYPIVFRAELSS